MSNAGITDSSNSIFPPSSIKPLVEQIAAILTARNHTVCVAETAAGGIISAALLSVPGASAYYKGGLTLYTLASRVAYGGWTNDMIKSYTGPTTSIVAGLAEHVRITLRADYTISESGTAGPTGGTTNNRLPGYVALAVASVRGTITRELTTGSAQRDRNMIAFAEEALKLLLDVLEADGDAAKEDTTL